MRYYLTEEATAALHDLAASAKATGREEHAYVIGRIVRGKRVIRYVIPTPNTFAGPAIVQPDHEAAGALLAPYLADGNEFFGSAHVHFGLRGPSSGDINTLRSINGEFPSYLCIVVTLRRERLSMTCHSIQTELVEHDLVPYVYETRIPADREVVVYGLGSGGASVALQVAKWGVPLTIIDHDQLERRNLARHILDPRSVGKPKAAAMQKLLRRHTRARIIALQEQVEPERRLHLKYRLHKASLVIDSTRDVRVAHLISQTARELGITSVHAGVFARGSGGYVFLNRPGGACIGCLHGLPRIEPQDNTSLQTLAQQYGFSEDEISAQAGLFTDIGVVSALQAKVALEALRSDTTDLPNLYLVNNTEISITRHRVAPARDCLTCKPTLLEES